MNEGGHWYDIDGNPCHTQVCKSKSAKNPTRPTNITDARKLGLLPSVSAYTKMLAAPSLVDWQLKKVAEACFEAPAIANETQEGYVSAMVKKSKEFAKSKADLGTEIHAAIETVLGGGICDPYYDCSVVPTMAKLKELGLEIKGSEKVVVNAPEGYAGTTDALFAHGIVDFKSATNLPGKNVYPGHAMQIAAYHMAHFDFIESDHYGFNFYISTTNPGEVQVVRYGPDDLRKYWQGFLHCAALYRLVNDFDPRKP